MELTTTPNLTEELCIDLENNQVKSKDTNEFDDRSIVRREIEPSHEVNNRDKQPNLIYSSEPGKRDEKEPKAYLVELEINLPEVDSNGPDDYYYYDYSPFLNPFIYWGNLTF